MIFSICVGLYFVVWFSLAPTAARRVADHPGKAYCHADIQSKYQSICRKYHPSNCLRPDPVTKTEVSVRDASIGMLAAAFWPLALGFLPLLMVQRTANRKPSRGMLQRRIVALEADKAQWEKEH